MKRAYFALIFTILFVLISPALLRAAQSAESIMADSSLRSTAPSTFLVAPSIPLGYAPSSVATGDLRRSGKLDLVTADYNSGGITVFLGDGQGNFAPGVKYDAGPHPSAVLVADINGDGRPDVLVSNESAGTISVLLGNGDGTLRPRQSYAVGFDPSFIATGDFNGNGKVDVAVAGESGSLLAILLNDGDGNLQKPVLRSLSKTPTALTVADFNNDGHADLALANADGTVSILLGKGAGLFRSLPDISVASGSLSSINSGDLNKDGKIDLVVTQPGQKLVSVLIGRGDGTFVSPASYPVGNEPISTLVADVNGDGVPALVVINKSSNTFSILVGNGDGTFKSSIDFVAGNAPLAAVAGDFYGNGHVDLAIINHSSQTVSVPLGNGDGTFKAARSYSAGVQPISIASGNLNGSKIPALVVANYCGSDLTCSTAGSVAVFLADDKGVYRLSSTYTVGAGPVSVALADLNGDGNLDIVALNRLDKSASVMLGLGDGTFRMPMTFSLAGAPVAIAVGDLNKDGKPDLAVLEDCGSAKCSQAGSVEILMGAGDGSFQSVSSYPVGYSPASVAVGDINGDKNLDLVVANRCGKDASCQSPGTATVLIGDGTGKFTPGTDIALGNSPASIALGNLTGSGLDLVVSRSTDNTVAVLHGNGDGTFRAAVPYPVGNNPGPLVVADFNGDGRADVAVTNFNDATVSVLYGRGDGTLQAGSALAVGSSPTALTAIGSATIGYASLAVADGASSSGVGTEFKVLPQGTGTTPLTSFTLTSGTNPSSVNEPVLLTATLVGAAGTPPGENVTFDSNDTSIPDCTTTTIAYTQVTVTGTTTATCTTSSLTVNAGGDSLTAEFGGDSTYLNGTSSPVVVQTVVPFAATINVGTTPTAVNQPLTITAQLAGTGIAFTPTAPSGSFNFMASIDGAPFVTITGCGAVSVNATGGASCPWTPPAGTAATTYPIYVTYTADPAFTVATAGTATQTYIPFAATITVTGPVTTPVVNTAVTLSAQLAGTGIAFTPTAPAGKFAFTAGGTTICSAVSVNATGGASCTTSSLVAPSDAIKATYSGDTNFTVAAPATMTQTVNALAATLGLLASPGTSVAVGKSVTFTAQLSGVALAPVVPSGKVAFTANGTTITGCGAVAVNASGTATCATSSLVAPADVISATYSGDTNFTVANPATITETITVTLSPGPNFGPVNVGTAAPVQTLTYNFSSATTLSAVNILTLGALSLDYTDGGSSTCTAGTAYSAGQSCVVTVAFTPLAPGLRSGGVTLFASDSTLPLMTWSLDGVGQSSAVTIDPGTQTTIGTLSNNGQAFGSAVDGAGNVYVVDHANSLVIKLALAAGTYTQSTVVSSGLSSPTALALDGAGNLYVSDTGNLRVVIVPNENGTLNSADMSAVSISGLGSPSGLAIDGGGNLYVADASNGDVVEVPAVGGALITVASGLISPQALAVDAGGNVYVAGNNQVTEYPFGGGSAIPMGSGYANPDGVAVDASGAVYVADSGNSRIVRVAPGGASQATLALTGISNPRSVALDAAANVYVTVAGNVYELNRATAALAFASTNVDSTSAPQTLTVSDAGNASLTVSNLAIAANFTQVPSGGTDCSSSTQLSPAGQCLAAIAFAPTISGPLTGTLALTDNALNNLTSQQTVQLSGTGLQIAQAITFTTNAPSSAAYNSSFTVVATGGASLIPVTFTSAGVCTNSGATYTMTSGTGTCFVIANQAGDAEYAAAPQVTQSTSASKVTPVIVWATPAAITYGTALSGTQLNATASVAGTFAYSPLAGTVLGAGLDILSVTLTPTDTTDYNTVTAQVTLKVNQATPVIAWKPASIQLGYSLGAAQLDATASVPGTFTYTPPAGTAIMATSQTLSVFFTPNDTTDYTTASMSVPLTVTPGPLASVSPSSINFGTVYLGTITIKNVTVTNLGNAPMTITDPLLSIVSGGDSNEFVMVNLCPKTLAAGKSCTIVVTFIAGPHYNPQTATINVIDNAPGSPQTVNLTATVINPQANFQPMSLNFGTEPINSSTTKTVTLTNTGATELNISNIAITGTNAADFTQASACPNSLAGGGSCTISVTFTPGSKNTFAAGLTVTDNTFSGNQTILLTGAGH
jgi:sugar lactone lactonase YvrE